MTDQRTGTVTLLFTDIEGSTRLLQQLGSTDYSTVLAGHHSIIRDALDATGGNEVKTEGDSFFAIFNRASDAVDAAVRVQRELAVHAWPAGASVAVRMGIHTGEVGRVANEYVGLDIHRAARIEASAHGGQVLLSATTRDLIGERLPDGVSMIDLGEQRLKDLDLAERLYQLVIEGLRSDFPPVRAASARYNLLPAETTTFVGRARELDEARRLLEHSRLLTLTGPGGTGKTRLSLRLAREVAPEFEDGVAFIQLAAITEPDLVAPTIRQSLAFGEESGRSAVETLADRLAHAEILIVLDNFEQVMPAARAVATLLESTSALSFVVTSRAGLRINGEQEYPVPPLSVPPGGGLAQIAGSESASLFVQRAQAARPDFGLTEDNAAAVAAICRRLDGLPLAIELAASRIKLLSPAALLARLEKSLDLLQSTAADRTDRQRTLRGAISWSYELLGGAERTLFRRLSIFAGGFRLEDAEAIVDAAGPVGVDVFDGVSGLVDNSLVRPLGDYPDVRFGMLETILEFGREQLAAAGELEPLSAAHARRVAELAEAAEPHLTSSREWLDRLEANHDNIRTALAWLGEHDVELGLTTGARLWRFWHRRGYLREGAAELTRLLAQPEAQPATGARAAALIALAGLLYWQLDYEGAKGAYGEALSIAQALGDERLQAEVQYSLAYTHALDGDIAGAQQRVEQARAIYSRLGDEMGIASSVMTEGMLTTLRGDQDGALRLMDEAIVAFRQAGEDFGLNNTLGMKARVLIEEGRLDEARAVNIEYLQRALDQNEATAVSAAILDAASLEALTGDITRAARLFGAAQRAIDDAGGQQPPGLVRRIELMPLLKASLDDAALAALVAEGRQMSNAAAVAYALKRDAH